MATRISVPTTATKTPARPRILPASTSLTPRSREPVGWIRHGRLLYHRCAAVSSLSLVADPPPIVATAAGRPHVAGVRNVVRTRNILPFRTHTDVAIMALMLKDLTHGRGRGPARVSTMCLARRQRPPTRGHDT